MKNKLFFTFCLSLLLSSSLQAQPNLNDKEHAPFEKRHPFVGQEGEHPNWKGEEGPGPMQQAMKSLDLSPEQRSQLAEMMKKRRADGEGNPRMQVMKSVQELNSAIAEGSEEKINACVDNIRKSALKAAETSREFQAILNDEQRAKMAKFRENMEKRKLEFRDGMREEFKQRMSNKSGSPEDVS